MKVDRYMEDSNCLSKAIDIAIEVIKENPPKGWGQETILRVVNLSLEVKENVLNSPAQFRNLKSLKYSSEIIFTKFQEGHGLFVEFWRKIKSHNLPYKQENKMVKILKRKKINNIHEYDFVIDVVQPYQQEGLIDNEEVVLLNELIRQFENRKKK